MKKLILLSLVLFSFNLFSQNEEMPITAMQKGAFYVGVNSELLNVSWNALGLSPFIGYAFSNSDLIYGSLNYTEDPRISTFKIGWDKRFYHSAYFGISASIYGEGSDWRKAIAPEFGVMKSLWGWLIVSPKIIFTYSWEDKDNEILTDFYFNTAVTFAVKL